MGSQLIRTGDKLSLFMKHATTGMAETDLAGYIIYKNPLAAAALASVRTINNISNDNLFDILKNISPNNEDQLNRLINDDPLSDEKSASFLVPLQNQNGKKNISIIVTKLGQDSCIVTFENESKDNNKKNEIEQALLDKAVTLEKYQIASNILHDIGNAVIGLSSYTTRIKRSLEQDNSDNLNNLAGFFKSQHEVFSTAVGTAKADAIVKLVAGIAQTQKAGQLDIGNSNAELQKIVTHIQEILNIHRQYISGSDDMGKKQVSLKGITNDCISMLLASFKKRNIQVSTDVPDDLPLFDGDRTKLMQVILNVLKNSIEAIDVYAVNKTVAISASAQNNILTLKIKDSGRGFDTETADKIFTRGFTTKKTGTGLGLEHCRNILKEHGASIDISSEGPGEGAETIIKFNF